MRRPFTKLKQLVVPSARRKAQEEKLLIKQLTEAFIEKARRGGADESHYIPTKRKLTTKERARRKKARKVSKLSRRRNRA